MDEFTEVAASEVSRGAFKQWTMKLLAEYLERALQFEQLAAQENQPELKAALEGQAKAYRKMAAKRAKQLGLPETRPPK